jgi:uncharacterized protein YecE (DUF72 family)
LQLLAGTSGFSYKEWCGEFYPLKLPAREMLAHYARRLPTVEINNTFYRLPTAALLAGWRGQVAETFRFAVKTPRRMTHVKRLKECGDDLRTLLAALETLEPCLGPLLVQLPPFFKCDREVLAAFVAELPTGCRAAFEFRHESWFVSDVYDLLASRNLPVVQSEEGAGFEPAPWTADWAYLRLRKVDYRDADLAVWLRRLQDAHLTTAYVYFKHEDAATGPKLAARLLELAGRVNPGGRGSGP